MNGCSRRDWFRTMLGRQRPAPPAASTASGTAAQIALILERFCLAHQGSFCSVCVERCPVPGAMQITAGKPSVVADLCKGCRVCQDVCPAPRNAVFLVDATPRPGMIALDPPPIPPACHG